MRPHELQHTSKYKHGVYAFLKRQDKYYFGISFKGVECSSSLKLTIPFKHHLGVDSNNQWIRKMTCITPCLQGTFLVLSAPKQQLLVLLKLLEIAQVIEQLVAAEKTEVKNAKCDCIRQNLNLIYDRFVNKYGLLHNYLSYVESPWFTDVRLFTLVMELERLDIGKSGVKKFRKAKIFRDRLHYPHVREPTIRFDDRDLDLRLKKALDWNLAVYGKVDIKAIAIVSRISPEAAETRLRELDLVFRVPNS